MNNNKKLPSTYDLVKNIFDEHPSWNASQIYERYRVVIGDPAKTVSLNAIQKHLEKLKGITKQKNFQDLERSWNLGLMAEYHIPPEAVPYLLKVEQWLARNGKEPMTIREALWVSRLYAACLGKAKWPLKDREVEYMQIIASAYAWHERLCQYEETDDVDTSILDGAFWGLRSWDDAISMLSIEHGQITPRAFGWLINQTKNKNQKTREIAKGILREITKRYQKGDKEGEK